jgi:hypothetical protein
MPESGRVTGMQQPEVSRLVCAVAGVVKAIRPGAELDDRTIQRLSGPVDAAAKLPVDGTTSEVVDAARVILEAGPPAPPDTLLVGPALAELRDAVGAYDRAQRPRLTLREALAVATPRPGELTEALRASWGA